MRDDHPLPGADHVVDGVRLHVVAYGDGPGVPILFLHGFPTSSYLWRDVQRDVGHRHRSYAVDLVGLGRSEHPTAGPYDLAGQAQLLVGLLDELAVDRVAVVGHDLGASVGVHITALARDRVAALVVMDGPVHADKWPAPVVVPLLAPVIGDLQVAALARLPALGRRYLGAQLARGLRVAPLTSRELDCYAAPLLSATGGRGLLRLLRAVDPQALEAAWRLVCADPPPALVLWAEEDVWESAAYGRRVADELTGAAWVPIADAGHFLPEDRPERVAEEIEAFLAEISTPARTTTASG
ncbi:MAG: alpha/beta fold hydrolase [Mycobacteriales bacterium]|nr:alpha/beta fold hydrolase [Frankia sp.]